MKNVETIGILSGIALQCIFRNPLQVSWGLLFFLSYLDTDFIVRNSVSHGTPLRNIIFKSLKLKQQPESVTQHCLTPGKLSSGGPSEATKYCLIFLSSAALNLPLLTNISQLKSHAIGEVGRDFWK